MCSILKLIYFMCEDVGFRNKPIGVEIGRRLVITFLRRA
jgi:hypothetical protein